MSRLRCRWSSRIAAPINPYGQTKLAIEQALPHYERAYGMRSISLRYFNAAGADPDGELGEDHKPEIHAIPRALEAAAGGQPFDVFGEDYPTADGTCLRDYVHVTDLAAPTFARFDGSAGVPSQPTLRTNSLIRARVLAATGGCRARTLSTAPRRPGELLHVRRIRLSVSAPPGMDPARAALDTIVGAPGDGFEHPGVLGAGDLMPPPRRSALQAAEYSSPISVALRRRSRDGADGAARRHRRADSRSSTIAAARDNSFRRGVDPDVYFLKASARTVGVL